MNLKKRYLNSILSGLLAALLFFTAFAIPTLAVTDSSSASGSTASSSGSDLPVQAAYTFDDASNLAAEVGGKYPLSTREFGASALQPVSGYRNGGMKGYVNLNGSLFEKISQFTMGFRVNFTLEEAERKSTLFLLNGGAKESLEVGFSAEDGAVLLKLFVSDGKNSTECSYDMSQILTDASAWVHLGFTYKVSGTVSLLTLYVNGKSTGSSISAKYVDLSKLTCKNAAFHGVSLDDLYLSRSAMEPIKMQSLAGQTADRFYNAQKNASSGTEDSGTLPDINPTPGEKHAYTWAAYLFEGTFAAGTDYHSGDIPATVDNGCSLIDTSKLKEKNGYALIRREASVPAAYLTLDPRLFRGQSSVTFSCWVYRNGKTVDNEECLLDLKGNGVLRFSPYAGAEGKLAGYVEYTDTRGNLQRKSITGSNLPSPKNQWVHYALTLGEAGELKVYVNGVCVGTFATGILPAGTNYTQCRVLTGSSAYDTTRTAIDEVYVTPKVLSDGEIRKIHVYGLARYTSEVLPDPGQTGTDDQPVNPYAPDSVDLAEDAYQKLAAISGGFIGTTFDVRDNMGKDWNNSAHAALTGGRLSQGVSSYGLALDGVSFLRYPSGILDDAQSLTLSLSYSWDGPDGGERSQRIFDFSRKASSVSAPDASIFLEAGNGISGLRFGITDGVSSTYLSCDYNAVNTWTRITVTIADGKIILYLNDTVAATGDTQVDVASIRPNFCYVGRSGVKGDPMFRGTVDEVYISDQALPPEQVALFVRGISYAVNGEREQDSDVWGVILTAIIIAGIVMVLGVVALIVVIITKKEKRSPEEEAPLPVPIAGPEGPQTTVIGPRSAARIASAASSEGTDATVKFRKVDSDHESSALSGEMTAKFRRIDDDTDE